MSKVLSSLFVLILVCAIFGVWFTFPYWVPIVFNLPVDTETQNLWGTFGDTFGALNTLFSGLAFLGIIVSIYLQSKELTETRSEIKAQGNQFSLQTKVFHKQAFENTFFQMLSLHNEILKGIEIRDQLKFPGRDAFDKIYGILKSDSIMSSGNERHINSAYMKMYNRFQNEIGHYFRNLYNILKFIQNSDVEDKKMYSNLLRAQLSSNELAVLFYNGLSEMGKDKFKPLMEEFSFLKNLPENLIFNIEEHKKLYNQKVFQGSEN